MKFYPYKKGDWGGKSFRHPEGRGAGGTTRFGVFFNMGPLNQTGGGPQKVSAL